MEYCGGGDLSGIIKQALKHNRPVSEDTIWNYFMQILLALQHCHHPPNLTPDLDPKERRPQILHRDIKPDNGMSLHTLPVPAHPSSSVFLDDNNSVKLGDFGLSKALPQASFANTYVGVSPMFFPLSDPDTKMAVSDTILHVPRTDARKGLRLKIGHLVTRMSHLRTLRPQTTFSRSNNESRAEHTYKVCSFRTRISLWYK